MQLVAVKITGSPGAFLGWNTKFHFLQGAGNNVLKFNA